MQKKLLFGLILLILILPLTFAQSFTDWFQDANAGLNLAGGDGFTANYIPGADIVTSDIWSDCAIPGSVWSPLINDIDGDSNPDIFIFEGTKVSIYQTDCTLTYEFIQSVSNAPPVLVNFDGDDQQEYVWLGNNSLHGYEWNTTTNSIQEAWAVNFGASGYSTNGTTNRWNTLACDRRGDRLGCVMMRVTSDDTMFINMTDYTNPTISIINGTWQYTTFRGSAWLGVRNSVPAVQFRQSTISQVLTPICGQGISNLYIQCQYYNDTGHWWNSYKANIESTSSAVADVHALSAFIAYPATVPLVYTHAVYEKSICCYNNNKIFDIVGNTLLNVTTSPTGNETSNWMVGDFLKNQGDKESCLIINNTVEVTNVSLKCWDASQNLVYTMNVTNVVTNVDSSFVMGDFDSNNEYMCISYRGGLFCPNSTHSGYRYNTSQAFSYSNYGVGLGVYESSRFTPMYVFSGPTSGFILSKTGVPDTCGDGECQYYETAVTCPQDCGVDSELQCLTDSDCPASYNICHENRCVRLGDTNTTCINGTYPGNGCPYDAPICFEGICISAILGDLPEESAQPGGGIDQSIEDTIGLIFGTTSFMKFLVALLIIVGVTIAVAQSGVGTVVVLFVALLMTVFVTVLGLMPSYVLIIIVLLVVMVGLGLKFLASAGGG